MNTELQKEDVGGTEILFTEAVRILGNSSSGGTYSTEGLRVLSRDISAKILEIEGGVENDTGIGMSSLLEAKALLDLAVEQLPQEEQPLQKESPTQEEQSFEEEQSFGEEQSLQEEKTYSRVSNRSAVLVFDKNSNAPAISKTNVLDMEPIYPANGLTIVAADIVAPKDTTKFRGGRIENPVLPMDVLQSLGVSQVDPQDQEPVVRMATYLFLGNKLKYSGPIRDQESRDNFRAMKAYVSSVIGNSQFEEGSSACLYVDTPGGFITPKNHVMTPKKVRGSIESRGRGLNKVLGIPGAIEAGLERRKAEAPGISAQEFFSFAEDHLKPDSIEFPQSENGLAGQIEVSAIWTSDDASVMMGDQPSFDEATPMIIDQNRWATFVISAARHFCTEEGGGWILKLFSQALDRADSIREASASGEIDFESASTSVFAEVAREIAAEIRSYAGRSLFPARRRIHNRAIRRRMGEAAANKAYAEFFGPDKTEVGADEAAEFLASPKSDRAPAVFTRTLQDYLDEVRSCNEAMSGAIRLLKAYYNVRPMSDTGIACFRSEWVVPGRDTKVGGTIPPASWVVRMETPIRVYGSPLPRLIPFSLDMERVSTPKGDRKKSATPATHQKAGNAAR